MARSLLLFTSLARMSDGLTRAETEQQKILYNLHDANGRNLQ